MGYAEDNPVTGVPRLPETPPDWQWLERDEADRFLAYLVRNEPEWAAPFYLLLRCGFRNGTGHNFRNPQQADRLGVDLEDVGDSVNAWVARQHVDHASPKRDVSAAALPAHQAAKPSRHPRRQRTDRGRRRTMSVPHGPSTPRDHTGTIRSTRETPPDRRTRFG